MVSKPFVKSRELNVVPLGYPKVVHPPMTSHVDCTGVHIARSVDISRKIKKYGELSRGHPVLRSNWMLALGGKSSVFVVRA